MEKFQEACSIISHIADGFHVQRKTIRKWCAKDPEFQTALDDATEEFLDLAESKMRELIQGVTVVKGDGMTYIEPPDKTLIMFLLKTKGKKRGYIERQEVTGAEGKDFFSGRTLTVNCDSETIEITGDAL